MGPRHDPQNAAALLSPRASSAKVTQSLRDNSATLIYVSLICKIMNLLQVYVEMSWMEFGYLSYCVIPDWIVLKNARIYHRVINFVRKLTAVRMPGGLRRNLTAWSCGFALAHIQNQQPACAPLMCFIRKT